MPTSWMVETERLSKDYGRQHALDDLSLQIPAGEIFGLLGPNGSGKSTAIRLMLGMLQPSAGWARIGGLDCWRQSVQVRALVAYLPGELRLYDNLTGRGLLQFLAGLRGQRLDGESQTLARRFSIDIDRPLSQLSSGMKRKIALMHVILARTPLAILDEPTNTLDPTMRDELLDQIKEAQLRGQTMLFSSHVLHEVERVCDRVAILAAGKLVHLQKMPELANQRRITAVFRQPPREPAPVTVQCEHEDSIWHFHVSGEVQPILTWLARQDVTELRVEPEGLLGIYQRYHASDREALTR